MYPSKNTKYANQHMSTWDGFDQSAQQRLILDQHNTDLPPSYEAIEQHYQSESSSNSRPYTTGGIPEQSSSIAHHKPTVIPQIAYKFTGPENSPFARGYNYDLGNNDIDQDTFLNFIDGLNECFVNSPAYQGIGLAAQIMQQAHGVAPLQFVGLGLQVASGAASSATSYIRTKGYLEAINSNLFNPRGLHVAICKTPQMLGKIGYPANRIQNLPVDWDQQPTSKDEAKAMVPENVSTRQRLRSLEGYIAPLNLDMPQAVVPDSLLKKMGAAQAKQMDAKQQKQHQIDMAKANEKYNRHMGRFEKEQAKIDKDLLKLEDKYKEILAKGEKKTMKAGSKSPRSQSKAEADMIREIDKLKKKIDEKSRKGEEKQSENLSRAGKDRRKIEMKESNHIHKIRWLVVSEWDGIQREPSIDDMEDADSP